jgi:2-keto-4-pentenoate hydratase/2-oxohepta-3-ene-1,7-dioic acid hydratase in catechol pathway
MAASVEIQRVFGTIAPSPSLENRRDSSERTHYHARVDKIICVGKNYREHALELGDAVPEKPVLFLKPPSVAFHAASRGERVLVPLPVNRGSVHHECEIVVRLGPGGAIDAVTLGLDMTLRDLQQQLKKNGHPWEIAKVFPGSAVIGPWIAGAEVDSFRRQKFTLSIDGTVRQTGHEGQMTLTPEECVAHAAAHFPLRPGDVLFTGTPAGVGPVAKGQRAELAWGETVLMTVEWE